MSSQPKKTTIRIIRKQQLPGSSDMVFSPQSKKPKFLFTLQIQELANIPKISGSCYVKWYIKKTDSPTTQYKGRTSKVHIKDYRSHWSYNFESLLRLSVNKGKFLQEKTLVLAIYVETHEHQHILNGSKVSHQKQENVDQKLHKVEYTTKVNILGKVEINLAEYVNYEHPTSNRYLLQQSKVNCILSVKIGMELLKGDKNEYIAPSIKSSNIFKGISNVLNEGSTIGSSGHDSVTVSSSPGTSHHRTNSGSQMSSSERYHKTMGFVSDPVISKLYEKTFEISWDPRPGEFTAGECIDDIFNDGDGWAKNEEGVNLIDLELDRNTVRQKYYFSDDDSIEVNGSSTKKALRECDVREDLKSWSVDHILP